MMSTSSSVTYLPKSSSILRWYTIARLPLEYNIERITFVQGSLYCRSNNLTATTFASLNMGPVPSVQPDNATFLNPALCANTEQNADGKESSCQNTASLVCRSCKLVQVCCLLDASRWLGLGALQKLSSTCIN